MTLRSKVLVALAGAALVVGACSTGTPTGSGATGGGPDGALVKRSDIKIEIVTHGQAQDGFWGVVRNGVKAGASQMGVTANYSAPGAESDMPGMVSLIDAAVAKKPTGLVVSQQDEKSQIKNRAKAMKVLRARLYEIEMRKQQEAIAKDRRSQVGTGERSEKIRTYNFPQSRITDHRINFTTHQLDNVLNGDLVELVDAVTSHYTAERLKEATETSA